MSNFNLLNVIQPAIMTTVKNREELNHPIPLLFDRDQKQRAIDLFNHARRDVVKGDLDKATYKLLKLALGLVLVRRSVLKDEGFQPEYTTPSLFMDDLINLVFLGCENDRFPMPTLDAIFDVIGYELENWKMLIGKRGITNVTMEIKMETGLNEMILSFNKLRYQSRLRSLQEVYVYTYIGIMNNARPHDDTVWDEFIDEWEGIVGKRVLCHDVLNENRTTDNVPNFTLGRISRRYAGIGYRQR